MKKLKLFTVKSKTELLTREQLHLIIGGDASEGNCASINEGCYPEMGSNCCFGLICKLINVTEKACIEP